MDVIYLKLTLKFSIFIKQNNKSRSNKKMQREEEDM